MHWWGQQERGKRKDILPSEQSAAARLGTHENQTGQNDGGHYCPKCHAWKGALGLEPSPELYIEHMVAVFREVRRVLHPEGSLWINLGDSYVTKPHGYGPSCDPKYPAGRDRSRRELGQDRCNRPEELLGLKSKDLVMLPARVAIALQADGWYLRSMIPWVKMNGMPESTTDRPTSMVEYFFQFAKSESYYYDREAVRIRSSANSHARGDGVNPKAMGPNSRMNRDQDPYHQLESRVRAKQNRSFSAAVHALVPSRARRNSDWLFSSIEDYSREFHGMLVDASGDPLSMIVNPEPFSIEMCRQCHECYQQKRYRKLLHVEGDKTKPRICDCGAVDWVSHFATFPVRLVEPIVLAATSEMGACAHCKSQYERVVEKAKVGDWHPYPANKHEAGAVNGTAKWAKEGAQSSGARVIANVAAASARGNDHENPFPSPATIGWRPTCKPHELFAKAIEPAVILDPFCGSGRTAIAALKHGRSFIGIEMNPHYIEMSEFQIEARQPAEEVNP